jgi:TM2 domain-containing membrane protein YozV
MNRKPMLACTLSALIPGLGQMVSGKNSRGAIILVTAILIVNLHILWLSLYGLSSSGTNALWTYILPRVLHDVSAAWSVVFYLWQIVDGYRCAR